MSNYLKVRINKSNTEHAEVEFWSYIRAHRAFRVTPSQLQRYLAALRETAGRQGGAA